MAIDNIGKPIRRLEDFRFLTGKGQFVDDMVFNNMAYGVVLRSQHAHAKVRAIDTLLAESLPGVLAILTGADADADGLMPIRPYAEVNNSDGSPFFVPPRRVLVRDRVRYLGDSIAFIIAETRNQALDALERITIDYEPLEPVIDVEASLSIETPDIWDSPNKNLCYEWELGDAVGVGKALANAEHVVRFNCVNHRVIANPIEPRGAVGLFNKKNESYTLYTSGQNIHLSRTILAASLNVPESDIRAIIPDVGGGFGMKNFIYPETVLVLWAARRIGRPVKWIADRTESFLSDDHGRDHRTFCELGLDGDGKFLGLRITTLGNLGAYVTATAASLHTAAYGALTGGVYNIPKVHLGVKAVFTNSTPLGAYRGVGYAESMSVIERLVDSAAKQIGIDAFELRRLNFIQSEEGPYTNYSGTIIASSSFSDILSLALERSDGQKFAIRRSESRAKGFLRGFGIAYYAEKTSGPASEFVEISFTKSGSIVLSTGTQSNGQGHETTFPQIVSTKLGIPLENIIFRQGDTDVIIAGGGHGGSRSVHMGGAALYYASERIISKGIQIASHVLEVAQEDIEFINGQFLIVGTDKALSIFEVARMAQEPEYLPNYMEPGLDMLHEYERKFPTLPYGAHVCEVEVDCETGKVSVVRYTVVDDFGTLINPLIVAGQVHGGVAQGLGQALMEGIRFHPETGQLITGSFLDYSMPRADDLMDINVIFSEVPCPTNPLGVKGCGEAGAIGSFPAVINAIMDALGPSVGRDFNGPAHSEAVWRALKR